MILSIIFTKPIYIQKCKKRQTLGCVNPASCLLLAAGASSKKPSLHLFLYVCNLLSTIYSMASPIFCTIPQFHMVRICMVSRYNYVTDLALKNFVHLEMH